MGVAVAIVADVVWSAAVSYAASKVITKVAQELGVNDKNANILGAIGGVAAGSAVWGDASPLVREATGASSVVNPYVPTPTAPSNPAIDTPASGVAGEYGGEVAETASGTSTVAPVKDAAAEASWWQGDTAKTMMAGTASGMAQGYIVGEQMADEAAEVRKAEEREIQANKERVTDWTNFNDSAAAPKMTDSVKLKNPLDSVTAPTVNTPRAGMLTRPI